jgi:intracellular multiplication protein IcmV
MRAPRFVKRVGKTFFNVSAWVNYGQLSSFAKSIANLFKRLFIPAQATYTETFAEAMQRFNLSEEDIQRRIKNFILLVSLWLIIALGVLSYALYLAFAGSWHGFIACIGLMFISLAQAFRYHFWYFQLKQRRLGCTFRQWLNASFKGDNS